MGRKFVVAAMWVGGLVFAISASAAGIDVDLGAEVGAGDRSGLFLRIVARYFDREPEAVQPWLRRYADPDDAAVAFFLARNSGRAPEVIWALRRQGLSWWDVSLRCAVPLDAWFLPVQADPGPPYGKAYGHWKKHRENRKHVVVLDDREVRHLVVVRFVHDYYGLPAETAMRLRASGRSVRDLVVDQYLERRRARGEPEVREDGEDRAREGPGRSAGQERPRGESKGKRPGKKKG